MKFMASGIWPLYPVVSDITATYTRAIIMKFMASGIWPLYPVVSDMARRIDAGQNDMMVIHIAVCRLSRQGISRPLIPEPL